MYLNYIRDLVFASAIGEEVVVKLIPLYRRELEEGSCVKQARNLWPSHKRKLEERKDAEKTRFALNDILEYGRRLLEIEVKDWHPYIIPEEEKLLFVQLALYKILSVRISKELGIS